MEVRLQQPASVADSWGSAVARTIGQWDDGEGASFLVVEGGGEGTPQVHRSRKSELIMKRASGDSRSWCPTASPTSKLTEGEKKGEGLLSYRFSRLILGCQCALEVSLASGAVLAAVVGLERHGTLDSVVAKQAFFCFHSARLRLAAQVKLNRWRPASVFQLCFVSTAFSAQLRNASQE